MKEYVLKLSPEFLQVYAEGLAGLSIKTGLAAFSDFQAQVKAQSNEAAATSPPATPPVETVQEQIP